MQKRLLPWTSKETISAVSGLDAFIDGHSHSTIKGEKISDKDGKDVVLTQTGEYFKRIGMMVIDSETGNIETDFIEYDKEKRNATHLALHVDMAAPQWRMRRREGKYELCGRVRRCPASFPSPHLLIPIIHSMHQWYKTTIAFLRLKKAYFEKAY